MSRLTDLLPPFARLREVVDRPGGNIPLRAPVRDMTTVMAECPALNTWQDANQALIKAELPGIMMHSFDVLVCADPLTAGTTCPAGGDLGTTLLSTRCPGNAFGQTLVLAAVERGQAHHDLRRMTRSTISTQLRPLTIGHGQAV